MAASRFYAHAELDSEVVRFYRNLRHHRSTIMEGVRLIAFRNINHMLRAMARLGIQSISNDAEMDAVCDIMFQDQGLDSGINSRNVLEFSIIIPWEAYCYLLYVELEGYQRASRKNGALKFDPLESFCLTHGDVLDSLSVMRDKVLHPGKRVALSDAMEDFIDSGAMIDGHYFSTVFQAQNLIDMHLATLRMMLAQQIADGVRPMAEGHDIPQQQLERFQWVRKILSYPLPRIGEEPDEEQDQRPFNMRTWSIFGLYRDYGPREGVEYPAFLREAKTDCMRMLMRSLVLHNEFIDLIDFGKLRQIKTRAEVDAHHPSELLTTGSFTIGSQRSENLLAPVRVGSALLVEPLRLYYQAVSEMPDLGVDEIEEIVGPGPVPPALRIYRNIVFHLAHESVNPAEIEFEYVSEVRADTTMELLPHLVRFYMGVE